MPVHLTVVRPWIGVALAALAATAPARAERAAGPPLQVVVAEAGQFLPGHVERPGDPANVPLVVGRGGRLSLANADPLGAHNVTSYELDHEGLPVFASDTVNGGQAGEVRGIAVLDSGEYPFYCTIHYGMEGMLEIATI